jgi:sugar phosphate permease
MEKKRGRWFYGWTIVGAISVLSFAGGVETNPVLGVFQPAITNEFGWSRSLFTLPMAIGTFAGGLLALWIGPLMDRHGTRWVMVGASALMGLLFVLMGAMQELWQLYVLQIAGRALVASTFFMLIGVVIPKWFITKRGRAIGVASLGQRFGHVTFPILIERILAIGSWRAASVTMGITVWVTGLIPALIFLRRTPEDMGLRPDGAPPGRRRVEGAHAEIQRPVEVSFKRSEALRTPALYLLTAALSFQSFAATGINFHWFAYLTDKGLSTSVAVLSLSLAPLVAMPITVMAGFFAEKVSVQYVAAASYGLMAIAIAFFLNADSGGDAYMVGVLYGVATGMTVTAMQMIWADYFGREAIGAIRGMVSPVQMLTNALGPVVAALVFDITDSYQLIFTISSGLCALAALLTIAARRPRAPR